MGVSPVSMSEESALNPERQLIRRLQQRDPQAMMDLYDRYGKLIFSVIFRAVNDSAIAEDITQETFLRVWNRIGTFEESKGKLEGWLVTVARNRAFDYLRSARNSPPLSTVSLDDLERTGFASSNENQSDRVARQNAVVAALNNLNREQRQVIELTHFEGMSQTEIARKLQKPLGTVKGLARSALKSLRTAMMEAGMP
jgi:RNA polymerase sigma-70 factor (ECF subfamily)